MSNYGGGNETDTPGAAATPSPHPLAVALAHTLSTPPPAGEASPRILLLGIGSGRNVAPLLAAGFRVDAVEDDTARARAATERFAGNERVRVVHAGYNAPYPFAAGFAGALCTHALLHGSRATAAAGVAAVRSRLAPGGSFYLTLGSTRDPRCGTGTRIDAVTFAPVDGPEAGVPHVFFDEAAVRALFSGFVIASLAETAAAETVGRWAHDDAGAATIVHWFVRATAR